MCVCGIWTSSIELTLDSTLGFIEDHSLFMEADDKSQRDLRTLFGFNKKCLFKNGCLVSPDGQFKNLMLANHFTGLSSC